MRCQEVIRYHILFVPETHYLRNPARLLVVFRLKYLPFEFGFKHSQVNNPLEQQFRGPQIRLYKVVLYKVLYKYIKFFRDKLNDDTFKALSPWLKIMVFGPILAPRPHMGNIMHTDPKPTFGTCRGLPLQLISQN